ncbi:MAG: preprotein translocase subunit SecY [Verrucomicrobiota bacterium]
MLSAFSNCLKIPELRQRILFTLAMVIVIRVGAWIPCPGVNPAVLQAYFADYINNQSGNSLAGMFNLFSGGALQNCAIFALGIMPYITASIMMQLGQAIIPSLGKLAREEGGRQKITQYTRVGTILLCVFQGYLLATSFENPSQLQFFEGIAAVEAQLGPLVPTPGFAFQLLTILSLTTGTMLLMWIGEQITDKGIGNGISLVITVNILGSLPGALAQGYEVLNPSDPGQQPVSPLVVVVLLAFLFAVIAGTVALTQGTRRIAVNYAKQVRGNKMYGGQSSYLPLKVNYSGVMPIIFAQSIILFPGMILDFMFPSSLWARSIILSLQSGTLYYAFYGGMILFFSYFWVATMFNPVQIADDLKRNSGFIPGKRPGEATAKFLDYTMTRLTLAGAIFLMILALLPMLVQRNMGVPSLTAQFFGGTSLLIIVGVMLDSMRQMETFLLQRHYDGFLKKGKLRGRSARGGALQQGTAPENVGLLWLYVALGVIIIAGVTISIVQGWTH